MLLFLVVTPIFGQAQVKKGSVVARGLVYGPDGYQIWAEYGANGIPIRVIGEASPANGLDESYVISGKEYLAYVKAFRDIKEKNGDSIAKGAYVLSRDDYLNKTFKTIPTKQQPTPQEIQKPNLFPFTKSVLVRAEDQLLNTSINPVLLEAGINLNTIDSKVMEATLSVLLDKQGNVREASPNTIAYRMAYFVKNEAGIYDTALDDVLYYAVSMGAKPVAPLQGAFVGSSLQGGAITNQEGKYVMFYMIPPCPGFFYSVDTLVWAELYYRNFNPKMPKVNIYYASTPSVDMCNGTEDLAGGMGAGFGIFIWSSSLYTFNHIIPVDLIMFRGQGNLSNKWLGPTKALQEIGPRIAVADQTQYDEGQDEEINKDWPTTGEPEERLIKNVLWDLDQDGLSDLTVADKQKGLVQFWKRGKDPLHYAPSLTREMRIKKLENPLEPKQLAPSDLKNTDLFVYKGSKLVAKHIGLDEKLYNKDKGTYLIYPTNEAEVSEGDNLDAVLTFRSSEAAYVGKSSGTMTKLGIEVGLQGVELSGPGYEIEGPLDPNDPNTPNAQIHRGLLKSIKPEDLQDTDVYLFSENTGQLLSERLGLQYVADPGATDKMLTFWIKTLGPRKVLFHPEAYTCKSQVELELFRKEVAQLRVGSRVKAVVINRKTGYIGTTTTEIKKTMGQGLGGSSLDFPLGTIELYPPNLKIWAERTYTVDKGLTKGQERENVISFGGSGLKSDKLVVIKSAWLDHDGSLLPEELPGYTGRVAKVVDNNQVEGSGDMALFEIKPGYNTQLIQLPQAEVDTQHFYVQVCGREKEGNPPPSFASTHVGQGKLEFRPDYYVPFLVPLFNEDLTRLNAETQAGKEAQEWQPSEDEPVLKKIEKVYDWVFRPELQFSLFELDMGELKVEIETGYDPLLDESGTSATIDYLIKSSKFEPLAPFGPQRQLLLSLGYAEILALLNKKTQGSITSLDDLTAMQPAMRQALLKETLDQLEPEDYLGLQLYQADDAGNGLYEFYGLPLAVTDVRPFALKNIYNAGQFDEDVPVVTKKGEVPGFKALEFYLLQPGNVKATILDNQGTERKTLVEKTDLAPGKYDFFVPFKDVKEAINYDAEDPDKSPYFLIQVKLEDQEGVVTQKILYLGKLEIAREGEMLGQIMLHDVLVQDGSLNLSRQDFILKGRGPELGFSRSYSNLTPVDNKSTLGTGWSHNYDKKLCARCSEQDAGEECIPAWAKDNFGKFFKPSQIPDTDEDKWTMVVVNATTFIKKDDTWIPERGRHGRLEESGSGEDKTFIYTSKDGTQYEYDYPKRKKPEQEAAYIHMGDSIITRIGLDPKFLELAKPQEQEEQILSADKPEPAPLKSIQDRNHNKMVLKYDEIEDQEAKEQGLEGKKEKQLVAVTDAVGRSLGFEYKFVTAGFQGRKARLVKVAGSGGLELDFEYNDKGYLTQAQRSSRIEKYEYAKEPHPDKDAYNLSKTTDSNQNSHSYEYYQPKEIQIDPKVFIQGLRSQDMIKSVTYPPASESGGSATAQFGYEVSTSNERTVSDLKSNNTTYILNYYGNPTEIREPEGRTTYMTWSIDEHSKKDNVMTSKTDGRGHKTQYQYDSEGNIAHEIDPYGYTIYTEWDPKFSQPTYRKDRKGVSESWVYDPDNGNLLTYTNGDGKSYNYSYYATGERQTLTNANNYTITYTYDGYGNPDKMTGPENSVLDQDYDTRGRLIAQTDPNGNQTIYGYDSLDYPRTVLYPEMRSYTLPAGSNRFETYQYDAEGNLLQETNRLGLTLTYAYTLRNQIARIVRSSGGQKKFLYDNNGNLWSESDWNGNTTLYAYDQLNRRKLIAKNNSMYLSYDLNDNLTQVQDYNGKVTTYYYDELNRIYKIEEPSLPGQAKRIVTREYYNEADPKKNLKKETDEDGHATSFTYNGRYQVTTRTNAQGHTYTWEYDDNGNLAKEIDEENKTTTYEYDGQNRLRFVHKLLNNTTEYQYDPNGNRIKTIDANYNSIETGYDEWNRPYKVIDAEGNTTTIYRDALGNPMQITDANGNTRYFQRNSDGLVTMRVDAEGNSTTYSYDFNGNLAYSANPIGRTVNIAYDEENRPKTITENGYGLAHGSRIKEVLERDGMGNPLRVKDYNGNIISAEYNAANLIDRMYDPAPFDNQSTEIRYTAGGKVKEIKNGRGYTSRYQYDELNRPYLTIDAKNNSIQVAYDNIGHVKTVKDKRGIVTENTYDDLYRVIETKKDDIRLVTKEYDPAGNLTAVIDAEDNRTEYTYYKNNLLATTLHPDQTTERYEYDFADNLRTHTNEEGKPTTYTYDRNNRPVSIEFAGETIRKSYDPMGNLTRITKPAGNIQAMDYDSFSRLTRVIDDTYGLALMTTYEYDANDNLTHQYDPKGNHVEFTYDSLNRKTQHIQHTAGGDITTQYTKYDAEDNLEEMIDPNRNVFTYEYDELNRRINVNYPDLGQAFNPLKVATEYDENDNILQVTETKRVQGFTITDITRNRYDHFDRVLENVQRGLTVAYTYDKNGNRRSISTSAGSTAYEYDGRNRLKTVDADSALSTYDYYADGKPKSVRYPNSTGIDYAYDDHNRVKTVTNRGFGNIISQFEYEYDRNGNRLRQVAEQNGVSETTTYNYDSADRLTWFKATDNVDTEITEYSYQGHDRKTERVTKNGSLIKSRGYSYDELNRLAEIFDDTDIQSPKTIAYTYDNNGNTLSKRDNSLPDQDMAFKYDALDQLVEVKRGPPGSEEVVGRYDYNADGMRVRNFDSDRGDVNSYYDGNRLIEERQAGTNSLLAHYRHADRLHSLETYLDVEYYHYDALGSTANLSDRWGSQKASYQLDPWGQIKKQTGESLNRRIFTGHEHDFQTALIYFGARYYDPDTGRFITQDSYLGDPNDPASLHRYLYAYSNPLYYTDPTGEYVGWDDAIAALIGGSINLGVNLYQGHIIVKDHFWQSFGRGAAAFGAGAAAGTMALYGPGGWMAGGELVGGTNAWLAGKDAQGISEGIIFGGLSGLASGAMGELATPLVSPLLRSAGITSPVLTHMLTGTAGGGLGGYASGFVEGYLETGDLRLAHEAGWSGMQSGLVIGTIVGGGMGYRQARLSGVNPWSGKQVLLPNNLANEITPKLTVETERESIIIENRDRTAALREKYGRFSNQELEARINVREALKQVESNMTNQELGRTTYSIAQVRNTFGESELWVSAAGKTGYVNPKIRGNMRVIRQPVFEEPLPPRINDAERALLRQSFDEDVVIEAIGSTREICAYCRSALEDVNLGVKRVTPYKISK
jgi:RHS repeat-associated protein